MIPQVRLFRRFRVPEVPRLEVHVLQFSFTQTSVLFSHCHKTECFLDRKYRIPMHKICSLPCDRVVRITNFFYLFTFFSS